MYTKSGSTSTNCDKSRLGNEIIDKQKVGPTVVVTGLDEREPLKPKGSLAKMRGNLRVKGQDTHVEREDVHQAIHHQSWQGGNSCSYGYRCCYCHLEPAFSERARGPPKTRKCTKTCPQPVATQRAIGLE
jgi:hypothetical protein